MSNRLLVPRARRIAAPAIILPRRLLCYRGRWDGPGAFAGRLLVEGRAGVIEWIDVQTLLDGGWDGQPATAMLAVTHLIGFGISAGKAVTPGSQTWTSSGSHVVSDYNRLEVAVWGGGGGGGARRTATGPATAGGNSSYASSTPVVGNGGGAGENAPNSPSTTVPDGGAGGTASGGDSNVTGDAGAQPTGSYPGGAGGGGADAVGTLLGTLTGGNGGTVQVNNGVSGSPPGGGGSGGGGESANNYSNGAGGGGGGLARKLWLYGAPGAPGAGDTVAVTVAGAVAGGTGYRTGGAGARGEVRAQWD